MSEWKTYKLGNLVEITSSKRIMRSEYLSEGIPFFRSKEIIELNHGNSISTELFISSNRYEEIKRKFGVPQNGDMLLTSVGTLGIPYLVQEKDKFYFKDGNLTWFRNFNEKLSNKFLFYWINSPIGKARINKVSIGSTQKALTISSLKSLDIELPPIYQQLKIVNILDSLSQKIQLNTQTNQTLEAIAQAIFKSWFVDFDPVRAKAQAILDGKTRDEANLSAMAIISGKVIEDLSQTEYQELWEIADAFPSELVENTEFGEVPKGWEYQRADSLFDIGIGKTPPRKESEWFSESSNDMEWISIKDMGNQGMFITESSEYLIHEAVDKFNIRKIPENTVILSFKLTVGRVSVTTKETTTNEAIAHFKLLEKSKLSTEFLYCYFRNYDFNNLGSTSSIATAVNSKTIKGIEILNPSEEVIKYFNLYIKNIFNKIKENTIQSSKLIQTRDLLLPKLLNGEIEL